MSIRRILVFSLLVIVSSNPERGAAGQQAEAVASLLTLLANPAELDGKVIEVVGYLSHDVGLTLYLTRDHAKAYDIASAIAIEEPDASLEKCAGAYVRVVGRFGRSRLVRRSVYMVAASWWRGKREVFVLCFTTQ